MSNTDKLTASEVRDIIHSIIDEMENEDFDFLEPEISDLKREIRERFYNTHDKNVFSRPKLLILINEVLQSRHPELFPSPEITDAELKCRVEDTIDKMKNNDGIKFTQKENHELLSIATNKLKEIFPDTFDRCKEERLCSALTNAIENEKLMQSAYDEYDDLNVKDIPLSDDDEKPCDHRSNKISDIDKLLNSIIPENESDEEALVICRFERNKLEKQLSELSVQIDKLQERVDARMELINALQDYKRVLNLK